VFHLSNIEGPRRAYFLYPKFAGPPESVFRVEDREMPGPGGSIPIRLYTPNARTGLQLWVFFHGGSFVAGGLDTYDVPLRSVTIDVIVRSSQWGIGWHRRIATGRSRGRLCGYEMGARA
jgi:hypothetical protein